MAIKFLADTSTDDDISLSGTLTIGNIAALGSTPAKILVADSNGIVVSRTPSEIRSDIGAGTGSGTVTGSGTATRVAIWNGTTDLTDTLRLVFGTNTTFFNNTTSTPVQMQNRS